MLRQDPDVILVGELRDLDTISVALTAAETGHLVFATLHTQSAQDTITRVVDVFPADQQQQVRTQLAATLQGVVCQTLVKTADGKGRAAAVEIMVCNSGIRAMIRDDKLQQIQGALQAGAKDGMQTLNAHLAALVKAGPDHLRGRRWRPAPTGPTSTPSVGSSSCTRAVTRAQSLAAESPWPHHRSTPTRSRTPAGKFAEGKVEAVSEAAVAEKLLAMGYVPLEVQAGATSACSARSSSAARSGSRLKDLAVFSRQFATMIDAGLTMLRGADDHGRPGRTTPSCAGSCARSSRTSRPA